MARAGLSLEPAWQPVETPVAEFPPGQHTPAAPSGKHWKLVGHSLAVGLQLSTQYLCEPSDAQFPESQSDDWVHTAPRPPGALGPRTQILLTHV